MDNKKIKCSDNIVNLTQHLVSKYEYQTITYLVKIKAR